MLVYDPPLALFPLTARSEPHPGLHCRMIVTFPGESVVMAIDPYRSVFEERMENIRLPLSGRMGNRKIDSAEMFILGMPVQLPVRAGREAVLRYTFDRTVFSWPRYGLR